MPPRSNKRSFWKTIPGFLTAFAGFVTAITGLITVWPHSQTTTGGTNSIPPVSNTVVSCSVSGYVYNRDTSTPIGLPDIELAYVPGLPTNAQPVPIATTGPSGHFSFDCGHVAPDQFPIHLQMTYAWPGGKQTMISDDRIFISGSSEMNLYLSPHDMTNWHRSNTGVLRVTSANLFRNNFSTLTTSGTAAHLPAKGVVVVPKSVNLGKVTVSRD